MLIGQIVFHFTVNKHNQWLPPANEVHGKVMFLHVSVILFTGERACMPCTPLPCMLPSAIHAPLCHTCPLPCMPPPTTHPLPCMPPLPHVPPAMHTPATPAMHAPLQPHIPPCHAQPPPHMPPAMYATPTTRCSQWVGSMHPTGMYTCCTCWWWSWRWVGQ